MRVTIVTHCWRYSGVLAYQLSSLRMYRASKVDLTVQVFHSGDVDEQTNKVLRRYADAYTPFSFVPTWLPKRDLLRRSIGRDLAALCTNADVVWFTDADICFGEGSIDALADVDFSQAPLWRPAEIWQTNTKEIGDEYARRPATFLERQIDRNDCHLDTIRRASGAYQIVPGAVCRKNGYITDRKIDQEPVEGDDFVGSRSDVRFRNQIAKIYGTPPEGRPIDIPNLTRIRQSQFGRVDLPPEAYPQPPA